MKLDEMEAMGPAEVVPLERSRLRFSLTGGMASDELVRLENGLSQLRESNNSLRKSASALIPRAQTALGMTIGRVFQQAPKCWSAAVARA